VNNKTSYECQIYSTTVNKEVKITLNYTSYKMGVGDKFTLTAAVTDNEGGVSISDSDINWSSSNKEVATVDSNGVITAKKEGTATIYAKLKSDETVQATCKITVEKDDSDSGAGSGNGNASSSESGSGSGSQGNIVIPEGNKQTVDKPTSTTQNKVENSNKPTSVSGNLDNTKADRNIPQTGVNYTAILVMIAFVIVGYIGYKKYQKYDI